MFPSIFRRRKRLADSLASARSELSLGSDVSVLNVFRHEATRADDVLARSRSRSTEEPGDDDEQKVTAKISAQTRAENDGSETLSGAGDPQADSATPRARRLTTSTTTEDGEERTADQDEYESAMIRMWQRSKAPKKLAFPSKYPAYLKEPPRLAYEETSTSVRRKMFNQTRIKMMNSEPPKRDDKKLMQMQPRINATVKLRASYIRREPLVSQFFSDHYNKFRKPPFRANCLSLRSSYSQPPACRSALNKTTNLSGKSVEMQTPKHGRGQHSRYDSENSRRTLGESSRYESHRGSDDFRTPTIRRQSTTRLGIDEDALQTAMSPDPRQLTTATT